MEIAVILVKQIGIMFILIAMGYWFFKKGFVTKQGSKEFGSVLLNAVIPLVILKSFWIRFDMTKLVILGQTFVLALLTLGISMALSHILLKKNSIEDFAVAFSNAGFIGIPLVESVLGSDAVFYITSFIALLNILQWTYGIFIITKDKTTISPQRIIRNPVVISFFVSIVIFLGNIPQPEIIGSVIGIVSNLNSPLAMIILGVYLAQTHILDMFKNKRLLYACFIRLFLIPIVTIAVMKMLPSSLLPLNMAILIAASAPCGANVAIFAQQYDKEYTYAVMLVCMTTLISIVSIPFVMSVATYIL